MARLLKVWLCDALPARISIKGIEYEIAPGKVFAQAAPDALVATRRDNGRSIDLNSIPPQWFREEFDRHAWFESAPNTPARREAEPPPKLSGYLIRY